jgi:hypothetical protein
MKAQKDRSGFSFTYLVASLAIELKISPDQVLAMDEVMFKAVLQVLGDRAKERANASKRHRRTGHS